ncbi:MAG: PepSY domain-containing protein [Hyphomicrobiales bacterium]
MIKRVIFILSLTSAVFGATLPARATAVAPAALSIKTPGQTLPVLKAASQKLIGSSQAARIARGVAPQDKLLGVRLSRGASPRYVVKTRGNGRVREIVIDARTGAIIRR